MAQILTMVVVRPQYDPIPLTLGQMQYNATYNTKLSKVEHSSDFNTLWPSDGKWWHRYELDSTETLPN